MRTTIIGLLVGLFLSTSCSQASQEISTVNLDRPDATVDIKLSDILSDIAIVPLETRDDVLLSGAQVLTVTDKYIIIADENGLHQFAKTGKYIKRLALNGNGPNEFLGIRALLADNQNNILYYQDIKSSKTLFCLDMDTGVFLPAHAIDVWNFSIENIDEQGMIYGFPRSTPVRPMPSIDSLTMAYQYNPKERVVTRFDRSREFPPRYAFGNTMCYYDQEIFFMYISSDTLYRVEHSLSAPVPEYYMRYANKKIDFDSNGNYFRLLYRYKEGFVVQKCYHEIEIEGRGWIESNQPIGYYLIDGESRLSLINSLLIDPLQISVPVEIDRRGGFPTDIFPFPDTDGRWGYMAMSAIKMMALIDDSLSGDQLSQEQRRQLESLAVNLNEESNPVLILGKVK